MDSYTLQEFRCRICNRQACGPPYALIDHPSSELNYIQLCTLCHTQAVRQDLHVDHLIQAIADQHLLTIEEVRQANYMN